MTTRRTLLTGGLAAAAGIVPPVAAPHDDALRTALDALTAAAGIGALAEARDGRRTWRAASGVTEWGTSRPVPPGSRFRAGSLTKSFVATAVLRLAGAQRLALDDTLERWLPGALAGGDRITLHHLLQHTSGVANYTNTRAFRTLYGGAAAVDALRYRSWTPAELVGFVTSEPLMFDPGTAWTYSNTNYVLLALVIERVTGRTYRDEIARGILRPLDLRGTALPADPVIAGPHPHGYLPAEPPLDITVFNPSVASACGDLVSTAADLNRFYRALLSGRLLPPAESAAMRTTRDDTGHYYGYGLGLMSRRLADGTRLWGHKGDIFGYWAASWSTGDGSRQLSVAVTPGGDTDPDDHLDGLLAVAFG